MTVQNIVYSTSVKLEGNLGSIQQSQFSSLPLEVIQKIFSNINQSYSIDKRNILLTCRAFLVLGLDSFKESIYDEHNLWYVVRYNRDLATLQHLIEKISNDFTIAFDAAIERGNLPALKLLLKDPKVNIAFDAAIERGNLPALKLLLKDPKVNPAIVTTNLIVSAYCNPFVSLEVKHPIIKELLGDPRVRYMGNTDYCDHLSMQAVHENDIKLVEILLEDSRFNPAAFNNQPIHDAIVSRKESTDIIEKMLQDPRVDPSADNNKLLKLALFRNDIQVIDLLFRHPKIDLLTQKDELIHWVEAMGLDKIWVSAVEKLFAEIKIREQQK